MMVGYDVPDDLAIETIGLADLPKTWRAQESWTQARGDRWHDAGMRRSCGSPPPSCRSTDSPDANVLINHRHPAASRIRIARVEPFALDARLS